MMRVLRRLRWWLSVLFAPVATEVEQEPGPMVPSLVNHTHVWGTCKWNGQVWYARCMVFEWCTARIAC